MLYALLLLTLSAFTSSTILPGTSVAVFIAFLWQYPHAWAPALILAGIANTLGSLTSYAMARLIPLKKIFPKNIYICYKNMELAYSYFHFSPSSGMPYP